MMLVQILRPDVILLRQRIGILGLQIVGAQLRIVRTGHVQHGLALAYLLAGNDHHAAYRAADLGDHRRRPEIVVGHGSGQAKRAGQGGGCNRHHLHVRHLLWPDGEQLGMIGILGGGMVGRGIRCRPPASGECQRDHR